MATNLYEILEINPNATDEEVRKAYRRKALQTHPDRLPPTATQEEKAASEDLFRKVNNAYEVLSNAQNRQTYDLHGVWPPPQGGPSRTAGGPSDPFSNPPFRSNTFPSFDPFNHGDPFSFGGFTNPFSLFDSIFGYDSRHHRFRDANRFDHPWGTDPFAQTEAQMNQMFNSMPPPPPMFGGFGGFGHLGGFNPAHNQNSNAVASRSPFGTSMSFGFSGRFSGNIGGWGTSESYSTSSVNGVTHSVHTKRDANGNEHVTKKFPDGREIYTINGVEQNTIPGVQPAVGRITQGPGHVQQSPSHHSSHHDRTDSRSRAPPPPSYSQNDYGRHRNPSRRHTEDSHHHHRSSHGSHRSANKSDFASESTEYPEKEFNSRKKSWVKRWLSASKHEDESSNH